MQNTAKAFRRADILLWTGVEAIRIWDRRSRTGNCIRFTGGSGQWIPYVPRFYDVWEDAGRYQDELRDALELSAWSLWGKRRVLLAAPEDLTAIESIALEDFVYAAVGANLKRRRGVILCSQSQLLRPPAGQYMAVTRSCRCYCVAVVQNGVVEDRALLDVNECTREVILRQIRDFHSRYHNNAMEVFYPQTEEDFFLKGMGAPVSLQTMVDTHLH